MIFWATDQDELQIVAELLNKEIKTYVAMQTMPNVIAMPAGEAAKYDLMVDMYNKIIGKI